MTHKRNIGPAQKARADGFARLRETYAAYVAGGMGVRDAAAATGIDLSTAYRYQRDLTGKPTRERPGRKEIPARDRDRDRLFASVVPWAMELAWIVHDDDPDLGAQMIAGLSPAQQKVLPYALAALVDVDRTPGELLAWAALCEVTGQRVGDCPHCTWRGIGKQKDAAGAAGEGKAA